MLPSILVAADARLEHLLIRSSRETAWCGFTVGGPAVHAASRFAGAVFSLGEDWAGRNLRGLLGQTGRDHVVSRAATPQVFRTIGPPISMRPARSSTSRCPFCDTVHGVDRHRRRSLDDQPADLLVTDSFRHDMIRLARRSDPQLGSILVLDDPPILRFASTGEILSQVSSFDTVVLSKTVASLLARRLKRGIEDLPRVLESTEVMVAAGSVDALRDRGGDTWSDLTRPSAVETLAAAAVVERIPATALRVGPVPELRFDQPVRLSELDGSAVTCPLCGSERRRPTVRSSRRAAPVGAAHNLGWLRRRALQAADNPQALDAASELLSWEGSAYVVASGGSAVAGAYITQLLRRRSAMFAAEAFPSDYVATATRTDALILVSFSGNTPDHIPVIRRAVELGVTRIALLCQSHQPRLAAELPRGRGLVVPYGNARRPPKSERGFVSMAATVAPCALMLAAADGPHVLAALAGPTPTSSWFGEALGEALATDRSVHVFASGYARPAMLDMESKWVEGDLGPITIHQSKDFSHGRFMSLLGAGRPALPVVLAVGTDSYEDELMGAFAREHEASAGVVAAPQLLASSHSELLGGLELLLAVQDAATAAAQTVGRDLSRPERIDPGGLRLYAWEPSAHRNLESGFLNAPRRDL